jgi:hypothetical protein
MTTPLAGGVRGVVICTAVAAGDEPRRGVLRSSTVFYEVTITRSDTGGSQWIANDVRVLRRSRDIAYREGWWLHSVKRTGSVVSMRYVTADGETMEQQVRFFEPSRIRVRRRHATGR